MHEDDTPIKRTFYQTRQCFKLNNGVPFVDSYKNFCVLRNHFKKCENNSNKCKDECPANQG